MLEPDAGAEAEVLESMPELVPCQFRSKVRASARVQAMSRASSREPLPTIDESKFDVLPGIVFLLSELPVSSG